MNVWGHYKSLYDEEKSRKVKEEETPPPKPKQREPQAIVMNWEKQALLYSTLAPLHPPVDENKPFTLPQEWKKLQQRLIRDGFPKDKVELAFRHVHQNRPPAVVEGVLDWLCFHLSDEDMPKAFSKSESMEMMF